MGQPTILLIEDEANIAQLVRYNVEQAGFRLLTARDGEEGLRVVERDRPHLILLDLLLPRLNGLDVCRRLKQRPETREIPIIMLTAKAAEADKVAGLELGADDYVTKPFSPRELIARIRAVFRRRGTQEPPRIRCGRLEADWERHQVTIHGKTLPLTSKEFDLLKVLVQAHGRVLSREQLLETVWGYTQAAELETRTVDFHVSRLRRKLSTEAKRLATVAGTGYRFVNDDGDS